MVFQETQSQNFSLPIEKVSILIDEISFGGKLERIKNGKDKDVLVYLKHCSGHDKMMANMTYEVEYSRAIEAGFLTVAQATEILTARGIFTGEEEKEIGVLREKVKAQEKLLELITKVPSRKEKVKGVIEDLNQQLLDLIIIKEQHLDFCAEKRAQEAKFNYLLCRGIYRPDGEELWWPTKKDFDGEKDILFKSRLYAKYIRFSMGLDVGVLRYLARHSLWRVRYTSAIKLGDSLFSISIKDFSPDQLAVVYWSSFYQSIYEMMPSDRPSDDIIEDDASLDAFMKNYFDEKSRESAGEKGTKRGKGLSAWNHEETIVTKSNPIRNEIKYSPTMAAKLDKKSTDVNVKK